VAVACWVVPFADIFELPALLALVLEPQATSKSDRTSRVSAANRASALRDVFIFIQVIEFSFVVISPTKPLHRDSYYTPDLKNTSRPAKYFLFFCNEYKSSIDSIRFSYVVTFL
jgi:hypothetical protein